MANVLESIKKLFGISNRGGEIKRPIRKKLNTLLIVAGAGIFLIILANTFPAGGKTSEQKTDLEPAERQAKTQDVRNSGADITNLENLLAQRLEQVLTQINGVGQVRVTVNLASTTQKDYAVNTATNNKNTLEHDQKGGNRTITETNQNDQMVLVRENEGNREEPVVVKEVKPEVKGVIVVAEGAEDPVIKTDLMNAVQVYLDIPLHKVIVLPKEGG